MLCFPKNLKIMRGDWKNYLRRRKDGISSSYSVVGDIFLKPRKEGLVPLFLHISFENLFKRDS